MSRAAPGALRRSLAAAITGAVVWFSWAAYANHAHGVAAATFAGLTQAVLAFLIAFFMTQSVEYFIRFGARPAARLVYALAGTFAVIVPVTLAAHALAGTPEILRTLVPAWLVGVVFCALYALGLLRGR